jgi:glyoxylase-like metal-dependent hydrolase (beta-lactamase superfamily II)
LDHAGSLHGVKNSTGAKLYASALSTPYIEKARSPDHIPFFVKPLAGLIQRFTQKPVLVDVRLKDGQMLDFGGGIKAIHVPGHTEDNFAYWWEREKVLFVADLLNRRSGSLEFTGKRITWDMDKAKESARKVLDLEPEVFCVGHGDSFKVSHSPSEPANLRNMLAS